ncbi:MULTISPECIES: NADPH-dependent 7-cyano-7-deazaguanine reductase QueF [Cupriavidus]|uniref:NADPH-dependent 7-cyano-7-deazaguanine reductase QueF n=1 Tax=Cupriavidus TaxID=106589 RepID=UPI000291A9D5|nr:MULTISPECIES: NADPH-dependent 7-cyano-7-deazaguanine reductase QueF [Cupriavidus]ESJ07800.1 7-cyano-7-deazaguanine reductase [Cupriavidus sp. HPC(L)]MCD9123729.1 NADPH-dependent 7-cyano-7-deazaguanine reductase QueF [Cupriavidus sp. UGS-1]
MTVPEHSPLGKVSAYKTEYDASLLFPIPRAPKRAEIGLPEGRAVPFFGVDIWNAYELSWLNPKGKPQVALASFIIPADTPNIVESKSFKLYLNSFNQTRLESPEALQQLLRQDLSEATGGAVQVRLTAEPDFARQQMGELDGLLLDRLDIETDIYEPAPQLLRADQEETPVEETLVSHLLKSNCLVTGQPDWGSVQIRYVGAPIDQEGLLKYLISFRNHNEFHEQCVERIFVDVLRQCKPVKLAVYARYTRRGGLDINPFRTNFNTPWPDNRRNARQ